MVLKRIFFSDARKNTNEALIRKVKFVLTGEIKIENPLYNFVGNKKKLIKDLSELQKFGCFGTTMANVKYPLKFARINQIQLKIECFFISPGARRNRAMK